MNDYARSPLKVKIANAGMAHFPGTGPPGKHCRDCLYMAGEKKLYCQKFREMMRLKYQRCPVILSSYEACKYFHQKEVK